ncbi:MAG: PAS domain S-box protein [Rhodospirillales bacterium]|nr:PAS domain S-box protein [Rhodospirillales bacterium]
MMMPARLPALMTIRYVVVLAVLAGLAVFSYLIQDRLHTTIDSDAAVINVAGSQRMLSQRIALLAETLIEAPGSFRKNRIRRNLLRSIEAMEDNHEGLLHGDPERNLPDSVPEAVKGLLFGPTNSVDAQVDDFIAKARRLATLNDEALHWTDENLISITNNASGEFLHNLDSVVSAYQKSSEDKVARMANIQLLTAVFTIFVLLLSAVAVFRPMVGRIRSEMAEQEKVRKRLSGVLDSANDAIITVTADGQIETLNRAASAMFGVDEADGGGQLLDSLITSSNEAEVDILERATLSRHGTPPIHEVTGHRRSGEPFPLEVTLSEMIQDGRQMYIVVARDITERKRIEEDMRLAATVFESGQHAITITDADSRILNVNSAFTRTTGYLKSEVLGESTTLLSSGRHSEEFYAEMWRAIREEGSWEGEVWNKRKNGEIYPEHLEISSVRDAGGGDKYYVAVFSDITNMKTADAELKKYAKELQTINVDLREAVIKANEANRAKSDFLAAMSHELRTPLNAVIGFSEAMSMELFGPVGNNRYLDYLNSIGESAHHLLNVINDILDVSKIEAGSIDLMEVEMDVQSTIDATVRLIRRRAEKEKLSIVHNLPENIPALRADERRVKQMILNLLSNAVKFTPSGGTITLSVKNEEHKGLFIQVADTGIGISADDMVKAMSPFGQVDSSLARRYEGTGLGLPLTKGLIELHGGSLEMESEPGKGTTVRVRFPASRVVPDSGRVLLGGNYLGEA